MPTRQHQDIQSVCIKAEQLDFLMQTIHTHHKDFDCHQLHSLLGLAYDISGSLHSWVEEQERIEFAEEDAQRGVK